MSVSFTDRDGKRRHCSQKGYNVKIFLPLSASNIEVAFSVVGGPSVYKVDRSQPHLPWVKDDAGNSVPERFAYAAAPELVEFYIRGPMFGSFVADVDERQRSESLLELVSRDFTCVRTMHVAYTDEDGARQTFSSSGYSVRCHLPSEAVDVEVTFSVVGGSAVYKVDRRDPNLPWVQDANGEQPHEVFVYPECPQCVRYELRGCAWNTYVSQVYEQQVRCSRADATPVGLVPPDDGPDHFGLAPDLVPPIGGIVALRADHSEYLLPPEVLLFEPSPKEVFHRGDSARSGSRQIFLNTPLNAAETAALGGLRQALAKRGAIAQTTAPLPRYMETHALRMLQTCNFDVAKTIRLMQTLVTERVRRLPIAEEDVIEDLNSGFMYWHGRDRQCRPCLVIRMHRAGELALDKERMVRVVLFTLEYALRFAMVPGRVENWVVVIDLQDVMSIVSPLHVGSMAATASAIGTTLDKVYCARMAWIKIINMPGSSMLTRVINGLIPAEKKDKVSFPVDAAAALAEHFEPNQLERRYGGTAMDLEPGGTYPYHFFPNPRGQAARPLAHSGSDDSVAMGTCSTLASTADGDAVGDVDGFSLHEPTSLEFHEGHLWDESSAQVQERWLESAASGLLTPHAAAAASRKLGEKIRPCRNLSDWTRAVRPRASSVVYTRRMTSVSDLDEAAGDRGDGADGAMAEDGEAIR